MASTFAFSFFHCSLFIRPYAAHPLSCTTNLPPHPPRVESRPAQMHLAAQSHLSCGGSPQVLQGRPDRLDRAVEGVDRGILTCTTCASGSVLAVRDKTQETAG